ncbi:hypothetical protein EDD15DRAFT_2199071 [Pisolithus albus]|nr:hypothetical protein EDD15DRAFT_2199071 [Pisolithus albus]
MPKILTSLIKLNHIIHFHLYTPVQQGTGVVRQVGLEEMDKGTKLIVAKGTPGSSDLYEMQHSHTSFVESLGQDGMSSDESDHEGHRGEATYHILDKDWCSKQVTAWLRMLDSLHPHLRYNGKWRATAGAWPHFRTTSLHDSKGAPVKGLPVDFYSRNWYGAQNTFAREQLQAKEQSNTLAIPAEHAKIAEKYDLSDRRVVHGHMFS